MSLLNEIRSNVRLRIGIAGILGIVWFYALLEVHDNNGLLLNQYKQTAGQLARLVSQQNQTQWHERAKEAKSALAATESKLWQNTSIARAQAEQQDWLNQHLAQAGAVRYTVNVAESDAETEGQQNKAKSESPLADLTRVRARLEFNTDPQALQTLMASFLKSEHQIIVEALLVKPQRTAMTVAAWYKLPSPAPTSQQKKIR